MTPTFITKQRYLSDLKALDDKYWKNAEDRWTYHEATAELARGVGLASPDDVLEMGTMGVKIVNGSHTMDHSWVWNKLTGQPTYQHDAREFPWPIKDKQYKLFIALRVFHHLYPCQRECFLEAARIASNIIIVVPEKFDDRRKEFKDTSRGISRDAFTEWNTGQPPTKIIELRGSSTLFFWGEDCL